jgi:NtrC-family two-component system sensor histidine kinase KinB
MTLRSRLLLAQAPLALALALVAVFAVLTVTELGRAGQEILADNYRSVLAAQRMKEAQERIDRGALLIVAGDTARGLAQISEHQPHFEDELRFQERNITEAGEAEATRQLRTGWTQYLAALEALSDHPNERRRFYLETLEPAFLEVKKKADAILALNQDAMVRKSEALRSKSERVNSWTITAVLGALIVGFAVSVNLTNRALRPVGVLSQAVRRLGQGDLEARAIVQGPAELKQLSDDFNAMAARLQTYRQSSLGELLQAQQAAQAAIDSLPDPVMVFATDAGLLNMNHTAETLLGFSLDTAGDPMARAAPLVREVVERVRSFVLSGKGPYTPRGYEEAVRIEAPEGPAFLLPRGAPVYAESSGIIGATVVLQDVTRLRRFDELKNDLVATVAHEFRTPLTSLRMAIHLCAEETVGPVTPKQADLLFSAREDCERLKGIVDDLLDLSRIQSGSLELELKDAPIDAVIADAIAAHQSAAEQRGIRLVCQAEPFPETIRVDPNRLALVLSNLISNAIRYSPTGAEVIVRAQKAGTQARFVVEDRGPGIPAEHQERIFEKFYRVPGGTSEGAGLGLAIAREIVEAHGGEIGVESTSGEGSRFWFTVPLRGAGKA